MALLESIFKAYDVRGTVPDQLDAVLAEAIGWAFATFSKSSQILVARDMRPSGVELAGAFSRGVRSAGSDVIDIGLASTDMMYFGSGELDIPGAMFTASHNPAAYNGIKFCLAGARPVGQDSGLSNIKQLAAQALDGPTPKVTKGTQLSRDLLDDYAEHVRSFVERDALRPLRVVADTANGMGGLVAPKVFEGLPFEVEILFAELDGNFPNHPADPIQEENLRFLKRRVLDSEADVGLAFDGDADRVFLVDERARTVSGSLTTALVARAMLGKFPGSTVLYNLICSKVVPETITESGGKPVRTRVGHSFIKEVMAETGAVFGGEHSGHYYFRDNYRADSGIIAALVVLEVMSKSSQSLSELLAPFRRYFASGEINTQVIDPKKAVELVSEHFRASGADLDLSDGLTVDFADWWFNLRPSNTEPLLRLNVEASSQAVCDAHVREVLDLVVRVGANVPADRN